MKSKYIFLIVSNFLKFSVVFLIPRGFLILI